jgi:hypothetical protein
MRTSIEYASDGVVALLATAVPELHFEEAFLVQFGCNRGELSSNSYLVVPAEGVVADALDNAGLTHARVTNQNQFKSCIKLHVAQ